MTLAIVAALDEELAALLARADAGRTIETVAGRAYVRTTLGGRDAILVVSGIGKVAAASTATVAIERFGARELVLVGVAGAADASIAIGDVVVASALIQHDMDATPLFPRFEVPLTGRARFATDPTRADAAEAAARAYLDDAWATDVGSDQRRAFGLGAPRVHRGLIASGDRFIADRDAIDALRRALPDLLAVEMEGAAVAQVCNAYGLPLTVVRTISDHADAHAPVDFPRFIVEVARHYPAGIVPRLLAA